MSWIPDRLLDVAANVFAGGQVRLVYLSPDALGRYLVIQGIAPAHERISGLGRFFVIDPAQEPSSQASRTFLTGDPLLTHIIVNKGPVTTYTPRESNTGYVPLHGDPAVDPRFRALLSVPAMFRAARIGVLCCDSPMEDAFDNWGRLTVIQSHANLLAAEYVVKRARR